MRKGRSRFSDFQCISYHVLPSGPCLVGDGPTKAQKKKGRASGKQRGSIAIATFPAKEETIETSADKQPGNRSKRRKTTKSVKEEPKDAIEAAAVAIKVEVGELSRNQTDLPLRSTVI